MFGFILQAYTMFNVFLPKLLETSSNSQDRIETSKSLEHTLWDVVIFTLGGCPGAIVSAFIYPLSKLPSKSPKSLEHTW